MHIQGRIGEWRMKFGRGDRRLRLAAKRSYGGENVVAGGTKGGTQSPIAPVSRIPDGVQTEKITRKMEAGRVARCNNEAALRSKRPDKYAQLEQHIVSDDGHCLAAYGGDIVRCEHEYSKVGTSGFFDQIDQRLTHWSKDALIPNGWIGLILQIFLKRVGHIHRFS